MPLDSPAADTRFPGWYTDPVDARAERFWNGLGWSDQTRPAVQSEPTLALMDYLGPIEPTLLAILGSDAGPMTELDPVGDQRISLV